MTYHGGPRGHEQSALIASNWLLLIRDRIMNRVDLVIIAGPFQWPPHHNSMSSSTVSPIYPRHAQ
jgi:hypothetical protein